MVGSESLWWRDDLVPFLCATDVFYFHFQGNVAEVPQLRSQLMTLAHVF